MKTMVRNVTYRQWEENEKCDGYITFFSPTYNRSAFLPRIYNCLLSQTDRHFVWILVNDGSTDNTEAIAADLVQREEIPILYISKPNGGKHSAFETALIQCKTEFFQCMDDDDIYSPDSVEVFLREWKTITEEGKYEEIGAVRVLAEDNGKIVAKKTFEPSEMEQRINKTTLESNYVLHEYMENWTNYRTDALRSVNLFPHDYWLADQHKFYNECLWQGRFARKYKCRYYYHVLREYRHDASESLSSGKHDRQHYLDMFINEKLFLDELNDFFLYSPVKFIESLLIVSILRCKLHFPFNRLLKETSSKWIRFFYVIFAPIGYLYPELHLCEHSR